VKREGAEVLSTIVGFLCRVPSVRDEEFAPFSQLDDVLTRDSLWKTATLNRATGQREGGGLCPRHRLGRTVRLAESSGTEILGPTSHMTPAVRNAKTPSTVLDWVRNGFQLPGKSAPEVKSL
jgi:hypothetical protein